MKKFYSCILIYAICILTTSCNKLIEIPESKSQVETGSVFADSSTAASALLGAYLTLGNSVYGNAKYFGLYSDEYNYMAAGPEVEFNKSQLRADNILNTLWADLYLTIFQCNAVIEETSRSSNLSVKAKMLLNSEAKFLRAYANFYLINFYDHVPLILSTDVNITSKAFQNTSQQVYDQIITDLQEAKSGLNADYQGAGKVRANKWAASALLARVYLYQGRWNDAEKESSGVINSELYSPLPTLENAFVANNKEAILQFWNQNGFVADASILIPASNTIIPYYTITEGLYQAYEPTDGRKSKWISANSVLTNEMTVPYYFPFKYHNRGVNGANPEYAIALRLSEQYLIRAEAFAQQNNIPDAVTDLNVIRNRASGISAVDVDISKSECLDAIAKERRLELFGEWGHRFLDLKRIGKLDEILGAVKPAWKPSAKALPVPQSEITYNSNLIQNNGY